MKSKSNQLTMTEQYIAYKMKWIDYQPRGGEWSEDKQRFNYPPMKIRRPAMIRSMIKRRVEYNGLLYKQMEEIAKRIMEGTNDVEELVYDIAIDAHMDAWYTMKNDILKIAVAQLLCKGKTDKQIKALMLLEKV